MLNRPFGLGLGATVALDAPPKPRPEWPLPNPRFGSIFHAMLFALLILLNHAPPPGLPPAANIEAAIKLWEEHPAPVDWREKAIREAVATAAYEALHEVGLKPGSRRWFSKYDPLKARIELRVPADKETLYRRAVECTAGAIAWSMTPEEIHSVRQSLATRAGAKFWTLASIGLEALRRCYREKLSLRATDADFRAVGLRPPKRQRLPYIGHISY
jgi:hypothetical protein